MRKSCTGQKGLEREVIVPWRKVKEGWMAGPEDVQEVWIALRISNE